MSNIFNVRRRKVGGIWFLRVGRLQFSFCLCRGYAPKEKPAHSWPTPDGVRQAARMLEARKYPGGSTVVVYHDR
jgi:hypothetical protein